MFTTDCTTNITIHVSHEEWNEMKYTCYIPFNFTNSLSFSSKAVPILSIAIYMVQEIKRAQYCIQ